ncbi:MAG: LuxR C-terminal-related transcriptional regulator, partial [Acidimicrobiia bacterium]
RKASRAEQALQLARLHGDVELEIRALARSGMALALSGRTIEGMARLDEAMTAAAAGETEQPEVFAETCCDMVAACEATLDGRRLDQWGQVAERFLRLRPHPPLIAFCGACCGSVLAARGDLAAAEHWLTWAIEKLENGGHGARCVDPKAKLAEIRVGQGRFEEAERLLDGIEGRPEATRALVALCVARGQNAVASSTLHRRLAKVGADSPAAIPILALLVPIQVDRGDLRGARASTDRMANLAATFSGEQQRAEAEVARGRLALATGDDDMAVADFVTASERYEQARMPIEAARARILLATALSRTDPETALAEARPAVKRLDEVGLVAEADRGDALVRTLGGRGRVGSKTGEVLTRREHEVLGLVAEGLTNAGIAERLFISEKTAGNHVSNVLTKLNLRTRTEAAAYAHRFGSTWRPSPSTSSANSRPTTSE